MKNKSKSIKFNSYDNLLNDIKSILQKGLTKAYKAVDNIKVQTYWQIGERIVREEINQKRAGYGKEIIKRLSIDLNIHERTLYRILKFYRAYPILTTVLSELSWSHYLILIDIDDNQQMKFYEKMSVKESWSVRELKRRLKNKEYEKARKKGKIITRLQKQFPLPEEVFKDSYDFKFLDLDKGYKEEDLKNELIKKLEKFLQELGSGFFVGRREVPVLIEGNYDLVDLELFHSGLLCYILVEIKTEKFKHSHVSQMYSYLNWYKENKCSLKQNSPIGLIICKTKEEETVHYALGDLKKEIFVAEYKTKLPSEQEIKSKLIEAEKK
ncbi:MAG TPA: DUF1016 family protein [Thermodesulfobacterium geofontis]|nr:DUF1016 family protein [Thermodesulfobacterium geofontis]